MKYEIEVKETVSKINTYTVEVKDEEELEYLILRIEDDIDDASNHDDVLQVIADAGYEVVKFCEGAEDVEYELL